MYGTMYAGIVRASVCILLVLIVPDTDGLVHGAGSNDGFSDTHIHTCHCSIVE